MKVYSAHRFPYPNFWHGWAWCDVDVYRQGWRVLVVLRDQNDHGGTSLTNALETVARRVRREVLEPLRLDRLEILWITWDRIDRISSVVSFEDPVGLEGPRWSYLSPTKFALILEGFGAPNQLEEWIREGTLELKGWEDRRRTDTD